MEMNFPHVNTRSGAPFARYDHCAHQRGFLAEAISRQSGSVTVRAMLCAAKTGPEESIFEDANVNDTIDARIRYFAAVLFRVAAGPAPYGAFLPFGNIEFSNSAIYDQSVYQDSLVNRKLDGVINTVSEVQITKPGQEN